MKPMTIWQRLDRALLLLILLLFVAVGLAFWVALEHSNANQRSDQLARDRYLISYDVMVMIDAMRVMATDPKNELERKRYHDMENELAAKLDEMQRSFKEFPQLVTALKN